MYCSTRTVLWLPFTFAAYNMLHALVLRLSRCFAAPPSIQYAGDQQPFVACVSGSSLGAAPPALRSSFGSWWSQNVATSSAAAAQPAGQGSSYPSVSGLAAVSGSGQSQIDGSLSGEQAPQQQGMRLSSSMSSGLAAVHDSAASTGGSAHGAGHTRDSSSGLVELRDSNQGLSASSGLLGACSASTGGAGNLRNSVTDQSDTSSVSSVSISGQTPGSMSGLDQQGGLATLAGSNSSLGGLAAAATAATGASTPGAGWDGSNTATAASSSYPGPASMGQWSNGGGINPAASAPAGIISPAGGFSISELNLRSYYASRPAAQGLLGGARGHGAAAGLRDDAAWSSGVAGIGRNSPRPTREPPSPVLRGLVTRPELALCLLTEVSCARVPMMQERCKMHSLNTPSAAWLCSSPEPDGAILWGNAGIASRLFVLASPCCHNGPAGFPQLLHLARDHHHLVHHRPLHPRVQYTMQVLAVVGLCCQLVLSTPGCL